MKNSIIFLLAFFIANIAIAKTAEEKADRVIIDYLTVNLSKAWEAYYSQYSLCADKEKGTLPADKFKPLNLTKQQVYTILRYYTTRHFNACMGDKYINLVQALAAAREFYISPVNEQNDPTFNALKAPTMYLVDELQYKAKYLAIPEPIRDKLEQLPELKQPYAFGPSYRAITEH